MCGLCFAVRQLLRRQKEPNASQHTPAVAGGSDLTRSHDEEGKKENAEYIVCPCTCGDDELRIEPLSTNVNEGNCVCNNTDLFSEVMNNIKRRGPDQFNVTRRTFVDSTGGVEYMGGGSDKKRTPALVNSTPPHVVFTEAQGAAAVLGLRGHAPVAQPYEIDVETDDIEGRSEPNKSYLMWNGEIFNGELCPPPWGSDTMALASRLSQVEQECAVATHAIATSSSSSSTALLPLVERQRLFLSRCVLVFEEEIQGPYAFLFYASQLQCAVFGRDPLGKRSLLAHVGVYSSRDAEKEGGVEELEVEVIVSSVGVQHASRNHLCGSAVIAGATEQQQQQQQLSINTPSHNLSAHPCSPTADSVMTQTPATRAIANDGIEATVAAAAAAVPVHGVSLSKRAQKKRQRESEQNQQQQRQQFNRGDEGEEEAALAGEGTDQGVSTCWVELPVTGLYCLPLTTPLIRSASTAVAPPTELQIPRDGEPGGSRSVKSLEAALLHCEWTRATHLVHPLLRTSLELSSHCSPRPHQQPSSSWSVSGPGRKVAVAAVPPATLEDSLVALPPLLRGIIQAALAPAAPLPLDATLEALEKHKADTWVRLVAARYVAALAISVQRRCNVANSGAEDARNAETLRNAQRRPLCILFSGGIDCTVLAALAHYLLPLETPIELVNVAFGPTPEQAPDRVTALKVVEELLRLPQPQAQDDGVKESGGATVVTEREWRLVLVDVPHKKSAHTEHILDLINPRNVVMDLDIGTALWHAARGAGRMQVLHHSDVVAVEPTERSHPDAQQVASSRPFSMSDQLATFSKHFRVHEEKGGSHATAALGAEAQRPLLPFSKDGEEVTDEERFAPLIEVLVAEGRQSGGPDTPVLLSTLGKEYARYLNVVVEHYQYRKMGCYVNDAVKAGLVTFVPGAPSKAIRLLRLEDRRRARCEAPSQWFMTSRMKAEAETERAASDDEKAATAIEADVSAAEMAREPLPGTFSLQYDSLAKVLLLGMGADETLGGYTRYRRFFQREGVPGARRELSKDFGRLWQRNLGRDDRIVMDSGREPRLPYLDEELLATLEAIVQETRAMVVARDQEQRGRLQEGKKEEEEEAARLLDVAAAVPSAKEDALLLASIEPVLSFTLGAGEGDKRILRNAARILGLGAVTRLQKRAMQFGSRVAERRVKGSTEL